MQQFWVLQTEARKKTVWLVVLYAVILVFFGLVAAVGLVYLWEMLDPVYSYQSEIAIRRFIIVLVSIPAILWGLSIFSPASRRNGGKSVAESLNGTLVSPQTTDFAERRLLNVVEEMALASGMPVPPVYLLYNEDSINAFAAGTGINNAVIGITRGALSHLSRDELQAVVAHEFSHILNEDMRINMRFAALLFGLMSIVIAGRFFFEGARLVRNRNSATWGMACIFLAILCLCIGLMTHFFGRIIQAAVNRQREFLADASSVQFTRSHALASALKKIGGHSQGSLLRSTKTASNYSHFFFGETEHSLFSTHPPLSQRIKRIEPSWDGTYPEVLPLAGAEAETEQPQRIDGVKPAASAGHAGMVGFDNAMPPYLSGLARAAQQQAPLNNILSPHYGQPAQPDQSGQPDQTTEPGQASQPGQTGTGQFQQSISILYSASKEPLEACYMILGLLLSEDSRTSQRQLASFSSPETQHRIAAYREHFKQAGANFYLPIIEQAMPALKRLSQAQYLTIGQTIRRWILADDNVSFEEWILYRLFEHQVGQQYTQKLPPLSLMKVHPRQALLNMTMVFAQLGSIEFASTAHISGSAEKTEDWQKIPGWQTTPSVPSMLAVDASLTALQRLSPAIRGEVVDKAIKAASADAEITVDEAMLLRVLSLCLDIPLTLDIWQDMPGIFPLPVSTAPAN